MKADNSYLDRLNQHLAGFPVRDVGFLIDELLRIRKEGRNVFLIGNGGSASTASHAANDWMIGSGLARPSLKVISLSESIAQVSAIGNDDDFSNIFSRPLKLLGNEGDLLVAFSASGNSRNVSKALKVAREIGASSFSRTN